jgi:hypothetical protein
MFFQNPNFYYVTIGLQAICAIHCLRRGKQQKWIWIIVFLPMIGCLAYIFMEMFNANDMKNVQSGVGSLLNPTGSIRKLEENLRFADTFKNKVALADAYLATGNIDKAIALYESCLTGSFTEHEHVNKQLIIAYFEVSRFAEIAVIGKKIYNLPQFAHSRAHMIYAISLANTGNNEEAEKEFKLMKGRFSNYESRYQYGLFLNRIGRTEDAKKLFHEMVDETSHLNSRERSQNREWFNKAKDELRKMG